MAREFPQEDPGHAHVSPAQIPRGRHRPLLWAGHFPRTPDSPGCSQGCSADKTLGRGRVPTLSFFLWLSAFTSLVRWQGWGPRPASPGPAFMSSAGAQCESSHSRRDCWGGGAVRASGRGRGCRGARDSRGRTFHLLYELWDCSDFFFFPMT